MPVACKLNLPSDGKIKSEFVCSICEICELIRYTCVNKVRSKAKIRNRYNQVPQLTQDTTLERVKNTRKHRIQESQEVSPFIWSTLIRGESKDTVHANMTIHNHQLYRDKICYICKCYLTAFSKRFCEVV